MPQAKVEILVEVDERGMLQNMDVNAPTPRLATLMILNAASKLLIGKIMQEGKEEPKPKSNIIVPFPPIGSN